MSPVTRRWFVLAAMILVVTSAAVLALLFPDIMPIIREAFSMFVQPGVTLWWFVLAEPFSNAPSSPSEFAFAAATNGAFWLLALWLAVAIVRGPITRLWFVLAATLLAIASAASLGVLAWNKPLPPAIYEPFAMFVNPGSVVWWFAQGTLFGGSRPSSPDGIAIAIAANTAFWLLMLWFVVVTVRAARRMFAASHS